MTVAIAELAEGKAIEVKIIGKLHKEDYEHFVPLIERLIGQFGKVRLLVEMHDFHGWDASALWQDLKFDMKHFKDIDRLALVGESKWEQGMATFCKPFTTAKIQYFDVSQSAAAKAWVVEGLA
jgi:SpoIIAA-like